MKKLKLLIVDDADDNRLVLRAICKKLEGFEIRDAQDGLEAVEVTQEWRPHIILMDIMMPKMDGFEASKIIKKKYPETVIMVVSAVYDSRVEENMSAIGINIYIHKPIDRELIRYKLQSIGESLRLRKGQANLGSKKSAINPFSSDIRSFKTIFDIVDEEAMMDFGMWFYEQYCGKAISATAKYDKYIELFYKLMNIDRRMEYHTKIFVEESYEEFFISIESSNTPEIQEILQNAFRGVELDFQTNENMIFTRVAKPHNTPLQTQNSDTPKVMTPPKTTEQTEILAEPKPLSASQDATKDKRPIDPKERELLHQSFAEKTSAEEYINDIGGDILDEILELSSIDEEWIETLTRIEQDPSKENLLYFTDNVLNIYIRAINNLFEFTALAYALSSLSTFLKNNIELLCEDTKKLKMLVMLLEHLGEDLKSWREHLFVLQDTRDIHYLDSSFFSSCMQIEGIIMNKDLGSDDDDDDMEFF